MATSGPAAPQKLPFRIALPFSTPNIPISAMGLAVAVALPKFWAGHLLVPMATIGSVWGLVRILDLPVDVILAMFMDHTRSRLGRYRLWLLLGAPLTMISLYALFMAPMGFSGTYLFIWLFVLALGNSIQSLAHQAWTATLAPQYDERSRLFGLINAVGVVGTLGAMVVFVAGPSFGFSNAGSVEACGWTIIAATPLCSLLAAMAAPEYVAPNLASRPKLRDYLEVLFKPDLLRLFLAQLCLSLGPTWMSSIYLYFFEQSRGFTEQQAWLLLGVYILAQIPGAGFSAWMAKRISKHRTLMVTATGFSLGLLSIFVLPKANMAFQVPFLAFSGVMAAGFGMMVQAMLADVGDEIRLTQGRQRMSLVYSVNTLAQKIAAAAAIFATFNLMPALGFKGEDGAVNTPAALHNLDLAFLLGPFIFVMLGGACVIGWRLTPERHHKIRTELEARDAELEATPAFEAGLDHPLAQETSRIRA
ncbi:MAG TPA: MFS transporter [Caulobacteraceae bacterium]|nr:MFS transporter [Caulobacteraceae bacterium]